MNQQAVAAHRAMCEEPPLLHPLKGRPRTWAHRWSSGIQARIQVLAPSARAQLHNLVQRPWLLTLVLVRPVYKLTLQDRPHYVHPFSEILCDGISHLRI